VEQRGIEHAPPYARSVADRRGNDADQATKDDERRREVSASGAHDVDAVDAALAEALRAATIGARWDVVAQLARELEARRLARTGNVVHLSHERKRGAVKK
jgi:hypothetical protein